jgi:transcriptional regulator with XRE-family HTH domain
VAWICGDGGRSLIIRKLCIMKKRPQTFADRFGLLIEEFGSRYRLSKASGVPESTLQQYAQTRADLPPRADILLKLARAANVSLEWLATGEGEMRPVGLQSGAAFADFVMVEIRAPHAALSAEQITGHLPFSRTWLETRLGLSDDERLMALEADEDLPPLIKRSDLLLVDRGAEKKLPRRDGVYVLSVARGLAVRQIHARLDQQFLVSGPGVSEQVSALDLGRRIVGEVIWRGGRL